MNRFFDSHAHLDGVQDEAGLAAMLGRAAEAGVTRILAVGGWPGANEWAMETARRYPDAVRAAIGLERDQAVRFVNDSAGRARELEEIGRQAREGLADGRVMALGEIGLDFHYTPETAESQVLLFRSQLELAADLKLPAIVHSREADAATLEELQRHGVNWRGEGDRIGVLHCFTGSWGFARQLLDMGWHISLSGIVTFSNAGSLREVAARVPEDRLLIETDSPFLAPVPHRGRPNEPAYLPKVAEGVALARSEPLERVAEATRRNALRLFGWEGPRHVITGCGGGCE